MQSIALENLAQALRSASAAADNLLVDVGGAFLYFCRVDEDSATFDSGDIGRIGLIFLVPELGEDDRIRIRLCGLRLGSTKDGLQYRPDEKFWEGTGSFSHEDGLSIDYVLLDHDGARLAEETLRPDEQGDWSGHFRAVNKADEAIHGMVRHVRWENSERLQDSFKSTALRYWRLLDAELVGRWGQRIYDTLPKEDQATEREPIVLIDVVSGRHLRSTQEQRLITMTQLKSTNPYPVVFEASYLPPKLLTFGVGPIR
jgi:hypothetical protein